MTETPNTKKAQAFVVAVIAGSEVARWIETGETSDSVLADIEPVSYTHLTLPTICSV